MTGEQKQTMSRRRWLSAAAVGVGTGVLAVACGAAGQGGGQSSPAQSAAPVSVTYVDWEPADGAQIMETVIADFHKKRPNITVDYQKMPEQYIQKLQTLLVSGTPPDAFALSQQDLVQLVSQGSVAELDAYARRDAKDLNINDFFKPHLEAWRVNGKLMGLARDGGGVVVYYNKNIFDALNITPPAAGYTWDEWLEVARRVTTKDGPSGQIWGATRNGPADWVYWVWQNGGDVLDKDVKRSTLEAAEAVEAIQYHADLVTRHGVMPPPSEYGGGQEDAMGKFIQGKAAMYFGLRSGMQRMRNITGFKLEVMPHPRRKNRLTPLNTTGALLPKAGKKNDASWYVVEYLTSTAGQLKRMEQGGAVPSRDSVAKAPSYLSFRAPPMVSDRINTIFPDMAREGAVRLRPQSPKWPEVQAAAVAEINTVYAGNASAAEAVRRAAPKINDLLK